MSTRKCVVVCLFFFNDTATTEIYTLSLHDALPIFSISRPTVGGTRSNPKRRSRLKEDRQSTRLNSSHGSISYAVFCLKTKNYPSPFSSAATTLPLPCSTLLPPYRFGL